MGIAHGHSIDSIQVQVGDCNDRTANLVKVDVSEWPFILWTALSLGFFNHSSLIFLAYNIDLIIIMITVIGPLPQYYMHRFLLRIAMYTWLHLSLFNIARWPLAGGSDMPRNGKEAVMVVKNHLHVDQQLCGDLSIVVNFLINWFAIVYKASSSTRVIFKVLCRAFSTHLLLIILYPVGDLVTY